MTAALCPADFIMSNAVTRVFSTFRADRRVPWGGLTAEVMLAKPFLQVSCAGTSSAQTAGSPASPQQAGGS